MLLRKKTAIHGQRVISLEFLSSSGISTRRTGRHFIPGFFRTSFLDLFFQGFEYGGAYADFVVLFNRRASTVD